MADGFVGLFVVPTDSNYADSTTNINTSYPLTGGGNLSSDRTIGIGYNSTNLKLTANQLDTIQGISTSANVQFNSILITATITANTRYQGNQTNHFMTTLADMTVYPGGYQEYYPLNFRFDQDVLRFVNKWTSGISITTSGFSDYEVDVLFSQYAGAVDLTGKASGSYIEVLATSGSFGDQPTYPYVFLHSNNNPVTCKMEVRWSNGVWVECYSGTFNTAKIVPSIQGGGTGAVTGVRWTFTSILSPTYLRYLGFLSSRHKGYQWTVMRTGDTMYGDLYVQGAQQIRLSSADGYIYSVGLILSELTAGYVPYKSASTTRLANSVIYQTSSKVGIGFTNPSAKLAIDGGLNVGGETDPGDNNAIIGPFSILDTTGGNGRISITGIGSNDFGTAWLFRNTGGTVEYARFISTGLGILTSGANPATRFQVGIEVVNDNGYTYDSNATMVIHPTPTSTTVLNDPKPVLYLARQGTSGQAYGARADFRISRYENAATNSRTRLDLVMAHGAFDDASIMTWQSNGAVGLGVTQPIYKFQVVGTTGTVAIAANSTTADDILFYGTGTVTGSLNVFNGSVSATATALMKLQNTNSTSGSANAQIQSVVTGANGGDPSFCATVAGLVDWSLGIDNSDSDIFKIGPNSTPSTGTAAIKITTARNVILPSGNILVGDVAAGNYIAFYNSNYKITASSGLELYTASADLIRFIQGTSTEIARFTGSGYLQIGTTAALSKLSISMDNSVVTPISTQAQLGANAITLQLPGGALYAKAGLVVSHSASGAGIASGLVFGRIGGGWATYIGFHMHPGTGGVDNFLEVMRLEAAGLTVSGYVDADSYKVDANEVISNARALTNITAATIDNIYINGNTITTIGSSGSLNLDADTDIIFNPTGNDLLPYSNYDLNLGSIGKKYLTLHAAELWVETLVAQDVMATIGGRIIVAPTTTLIADISDSITTIDVKHNEMASGDVVLLEGGGKFEAIRINDAAQAISGGYRYGATTPVTRNLDGTGGNVWYAGDALANTGTTGDGFIDLFSVDGVKPGSGAGPTIVGNVRTSSTWNAWIEHWAIGKLDSVYGQSNTYGIGLGRYESGFSHILITDTNGIQIKNGVSTVIGQWDSAGRIRVGDSASENIFITAVSGIQFYDATVLNGSMSASEWILGQTTLNNIQITASALKFRNATTELATLTASEWVLGSPSYENIKLNSTSLEFRNTTDVLAKLDGTTWLLGKDTGTSNNLELTPSALSFRQDTTVFGYLTGTGWRLGQYLDDRSRFEVDTSNGIRMISRVSSADTTTFQVSTTGIVNIGNQIAEHITISGTAIEFYDNATSLARMADTEWRLGNLATENIRITSTALYFRNAATNLASLDGTTWVLGQDTSTEYNVQIIPTALKFRRGTTDYGILTSEQWRLGQEGSSLSNVTIDPTKVSFRYNQIEYGYLSADEWIIGQVTTNAENIKITASAGIEFRTNATTYGSLSGTQWRLGQEGSFLSNVTIDPTKVSFRYNAIEYGSISTTNWTIGRVATDLENIYVTSSAIQFRAGLNGAVVYGQLSLDKWTMGIDATGMSRWELTTTSFSLIYDKSDIDTTILYMDGDTGTIRVGDSDGTALNTYITNSTLQFRQGTDVWGSLSSSAWTMGRTDVDGYRWNMTTSAFSLIKRLTTDTTLFNIDTNGYITVGNSGGSNYNTYISNTGIDFRAGTTSYGSMTSSLWRLGRDVNNASRFELTSNTFTYYLDKSGTDYQYFGINSSGYVTIGDPSGSAYNTYISNTGIDFRVGTTSYGSMTSSLWRLGRDVNNASRFELAPDSLTYYLDKAGTDFALFNIDNSGSIRIGDSSTGQYNTYITGSGIQFRVATTLYGSMSSAEWILGQVSTGLNNLRITSSGVEFRENLTVVGSIEGDMWRLGSLSEDTVRVEVTTVSGIQMLHSAAGDPRVNTPVFSVAPNGSGSLASGKITWDVAGSLSVGGWTVSSNSINDGSSIYLVSDVCPAPASNVIYIAGCGIELGLGISMSGLGSGSMSIGDITIAGASGGLITLGTSGKLRTSTNTDRIEMSGDMMKFFGQYGDMTIKPYDYSSTRSVAIMENAVTPTDYFLTTFQPLGMTISRKDLPGSAYGIVRLCRDGFGIQLVEGAATTFQLNWGGSIGFSYSLGSPAAMINYTSGELQLQTTTTRITGNLHTNARINASYGVTGPADETYGITLGGASANTPDTFIYRKGAGAFVLRQDVTVYRYMYFGGTTTSGGEVNDNAMIYRNGTDTLKTNGSLIIGTNLTVDGNSTLGNANTDQTTIRGALLIGDGEQADGIQWGTSGGTYDTNLYRSAANILKTDDRFEIAVSGGNKNELQITSTTANTGILIGADTNLYRSAANILKTDDRFEIAVSGGSKNELKISSATLNTGIEIGGDTNLYRGAANQLRTDDTVIMGQKFHLTGACTQSVASGATLDPMAPNGYDDATIYHLSQSDWPATTAITLKGITRRTNYGNDIIVIINHTACNVVLKHDQATTATNGIRTPGSTDYTLKPGAAIMLMYDIALNFNRWIPFAAN